MARFQSLVSSLLVAFAFARSAVTTELRDYATRSTNGIITIGKRAVEMDIHYPSTTYEVRTLEPDDHDTF